MRTVQVRVRKHLDGRFTAEYKGLLRWHPCRLREAPYPTYRNIPETYRTLEEAIGATTDYVESRRAAEPVVVYKNTVEVEK